MILVNYKSVLLTENLKKEKKVRKENDSHTKKKK